jgi:hypothetical protein
MKSVLVNAMEARIETRIRLDDGSNAMICKIERIFSPKALVVLRVSGRIEGEHVDTLRELIALKKAGVAIDLTEVVLSDREAVSLLAASEAKGIELRNCPAYIREWAARESELARG